MEVSDKQSPIALGCIADDVTGATDLAINLVQGGLRVIQWLELPTPQALAAYPTDAIVVALKTRSAPVEQAVSESLQTLRALEQHGCRRFFFKYCSTFDSTATGNIGPVTEALMEELGIEQTVYCPAFPRNGRTVYRGHLFVYGQLLHESGMANHPLTPMHDANLIRILSQQTSLPVGLLDYDQVRHDAETASAALEALSSQDVSHVIADCCDDSHLQTLAAALGDMRLVTGGSAIARYLPDVYRHRGLLKANGHVPTMPTIRGRNLILSGSCSEATNRQVAVMKSKCPSWQIDTAAVVQDPGNALSQLVQWAAGTDSSQPLLVYSTESPGGVKAAQSRFGTETLAHAIEDFHGKVARALADQIEVRRIVVAGGETAGAVVSGLDIPALRIGPEICPGVPWTESLGEQPFALALKSGNFGEDNFFESALEMLA